MLVYLTDAGPFCDWGENWPAWFQEESVNHGLAGLMASCLSLMLIGVNWGFQYTVVLSVGLFFFQGVCFMVDCSYWSLYLGPELHQWRIIIWQHPSVCTPLIVRGNLLSPHWLPFDRLDLHNHSRGHLLVFVFGLRSQPPNPLYPSCLFVFLLSWVASFAQNLVLRNTTFCQFG